MARGDPALPLMGMLGSLLLLSWACGGPDRNGTGRVEVTDSAGVLIVTSSGPAWSPGEGWRLDTAAVVVMGEEDGRGASSGGGPGSPCYRTGGSRC